MGDLSGGQILARHIAKAFELPPDTTLGREFYHFENITDIRSFKNAYRSAIDSAGEQLPYSARRMFVLTCVRAQMPPVTTGLLWASVLRVVRPH
jgi:hypothetical protein